MSALCLRRPHRLANAELRARVDRIADKLTQRFGAACRWQGNSLCIEHASVTGTVTLLDSEVVVDARLGGALRLFRRRAEREIERILDRELEA
jgi:putative polyhydroxyalkanoate system protein